MLGADDPASETSTTEAEILLGVSMWLATVRDWFDEELTLVRGRLGLEAGDAAAEDARLRMRLSDAERVSAGLAGAVACLDRLAIDPARIRAFTADVTSKPSPSERVH